MESGPLIRWPYAAVILVALLATAPLLALGVLPVANDRVQHESSDLQFRRQLSQGEWYPRWLAGANASLGSPGLFVYSPVPYFASAAIEAAIEPFNARPRPFLSLELSAAIALALSGAACLLWLRRIAPPIPAVVGSLVYVLLPFHVWGDLYVRYALSHLWAFVAIPLCLYGVVLIAEHGRFATTILALSYALVLFSHLLVTLLFSPFIVLYAAYFVATKQVDWRHAAVRVALAAIVGVGIAAVYVLPAIEHTRAIPPSSATSIDIYNYRLNFLVLDGDLFRLSPERRYPWYLTWFSVPVVVAVAVLLMSRPDHRDGPTKRHLWFWVGAGALAGFMMTGASRFVWDGSASLHDTIDFPWRYYTVVSAAVGAVFALGMAGVTRAQSLPSRVACSVLGLVAVLQFAHVGRMYGSRPPLPEMAAESRISGDMFRHYAFKAADPSFLDQAVLEAEAPGIPLVRIGEGTGEAAVRRWRPRDLEVAVSCPAACTIQLKQFYYPFWTASADGKKPILPVRASARQGLIEVAVPSGIHLVRVRIPRSMVERAGLWITGVSLAAALFLLPLAGPWSAAGVLSPAAASRAR